MIKPQILFYLHNVLEQLPILCLINLFLINFNQISDFIPYFIQNPLSYLTLPASRNNERSFSLSFNLRTLSMEGDLKIILYIVLNYYIIKLLYCVKLYYTISHIIVLCILGDEAYVITCCDTFFHGSN